MVMRRTSIVIQKMGSWMVLKMMYRCWLLREHERMKSNKYVPVGMLFLILAIILNVVSSVSDLVLGILYGISIAVLIIGLFNSRK